MLLQNNNMDMIESKTFAFPIKNKQRRRLLAANLQAVWSRVAADDVVLQTRRAVHGLCDRLCESLRTQVRTRRARVCMVVGVEGVGSRVAKLGVHVGDGLEVVDIGNARARQCRGGGLLVPDEPRRRVNVGAGFPEVVGRLGGQNHGGALGRHELGRLGDVEHEGVDSGARGV